MRQGHVVDQNWEHSATGVDAGGWQYAVAFRAHRWSPVKSIPAVCRRRKLTRTTRLKTSAEVHNTERQRSEHTLTHTPTHTHARAPTEHEINTDTDKDTDPHLLTHTQQICTNTNTRTQGTHNRSRKQTCAHSKYPAGGLGYLICLCSTRCGKAAGSSGKPQPCYSVLLLFAILLT